MLTSSPTPLQATDSKGKNGVAQISRKVKLCTIAVRFSARNLLTETVDKLVNKPEYRLPSDCFQTKKLSCPFFPQASYPQAASTLAGSL
jgi:hypothetical protein